MTKFYLPVLTIATLFISQIGMAQPVLTAANSNPIIGQNFTKFEFSASAFNPGNAGPNIVWDFSQLQPSAAIPYAFEDISTNSWASTFPGASMYVNISNNNGFNESYYAVSQNSKDYLGYTFSVVGEGGYGSYQNPETFLTFPFTYNSSFTDQFSGPCFSPPGQPFFRNGTIDAVADAYGTLVLPYGSVNDVLRVKYTVITSDTGNISGSSNAILYYWYKAGTHEPILTYSATVHSFNPTNTYYYGSYLSANDIVNGRELLIEASEFDIYPNPVSSGSVLKIHTSSSKSISAIIYSGLGEVLKPDVFPASKSAEMVLLINDLPAGLYFLNLNDGEVNTTKKFVIE